jgi:hypothetical protein
VQASTAAVLSPGLKPDAQRVLAQLALEGALSPDDTWRLAARGDLDPRAAGALARHQGGAVHFRKSVRMLAARKAANPDALMAKAGLGTLEGLAWNPATSAENLTALACAQDGAVRLRALCNPSTPEDVRRSVLADPKVADRLTRRRSPLGAQVVRAGVLARTNSYLAEGDAWRTHSPALQRAIATLPGAPKELLESSQARYWPSAATHPSRRKGGLSLPVGVASVAELVESASGAAHFAALERADFTLEHARRILQGHWLGRRHIDPEPHVIAEIVGRFGAAVFVPDEPVSGRVAEAGDVRWLAKHAVGPYAGTRIATAAWAAPEAWDLLTLFAAWNGGGAMAAAHALQDGQRAAEALGGDRDGWELFLKLDSAIGSSDVGAHELAELAGIV